MPVSLFALVCLAGTVGAESPTDVTFREAEHLFEQKRFPEAARLYLQVVQQRPHNQHHLKAVKQLFEIANCWMDLTREEMRAARNVREGKRRVVWPKWIHTNRIYPLIGAETEALNFLKEVAAQGVDDDLEAKALFLIGSVAFYREDFKEAVAPFSRIVERFPDGPVADKAFELAVIARALRRDRGDEQTRQEDRRFLVEGMKRYPELVRRESPTFEQQMTYVDQPGFGSTPLERAWERAWEKAGLAWDWYLEWHEPYSSLVEWGCKRLSLPAALGELTENLSDALSLILEE